MLVLSDPDALLSVKDNSRDRAVSVVNLAFDVAFQASDGFRLGCPSAIFLATYSLVRSLVLSLSMAMMRMAEFACLSPPRLGLCRYVIPDEMGTGATPQSMAKDVPVVL